MMNPIFQELRSRRGGEFAAIIQWLEQKVGPLVIALDDSVNGDELIKDAEHALLSGGGAAGVLDAWAADAANIIAGPRAEQEAFHLFCLAMAVAVGFVPFGHPLAAPTAVPA
jgi:hypothetical protein